MSDTLARLRQAEMRRQRAMADQDRARAEMAALIREAKSEGMTMVAISEGSGIPRVSLYSFLGRVEGD